MSICHGDLPESRRQDVKDVRGLFDTLRNERKIKYYDMTYLETLLTRCGRKDLVQELNKVSHLV